MLGQHRSTQRRIPRGRDDEDRLVADMIELARQYGRYGYRRIAALLRDAGWQVNSADTASTGSGACSTCAMASPPSIDGAAPCRDSPAPQPRPS